MVLKKWLVSALWVATGFLAVAYPASGGISPNILDLAEVSAPAGGLATVALEMANDEAFGGLQADILFDPQVVAFTEVRAVDRGLGMTVEGRVVESGRLRLLMFFGGSGTMPSGSGSLAELDFSLQGLAGHETTLVFEDIVLSDFAGDLLEATGEPGNITVLPPENPPSLTVAALKNPGNTRIIMVLVTVTGGSGDIPTVSAGSSTVSMTSLGDTVFQGRYLAPLANSTVTITATDTNSQGTGSAQVILALP